MASLGHGLRNEQKGLKLVEAVKNTKLPEDALEFFREHGRNGGKIGGKRSLETMTPEERVARAKKAAKASAIARSAVAKKKAS